MLHSIGPLCRALGVVKDRTLKVFDEIFGEMEFNNVWESDLSISLFGKDVTTKVSVGTCKDIPFTLSQKRSFMDFMNNIAKINAEVISALFTFYTENLEDFREYIEEDDWEIQAPSINSESELCDLVQLENIDICDTKDNSKRVIYYFATKFEDELGVSVIIVNGKVDKVVTDVAY